MVVPSGPHFVMIVGPRTMPLTVRPVTPSHSRALYLQSRHHNW